MSEDYSEFTEKDLYEANKRAVEAYSQMKEHTAKVESSVNEMRADMERMRAERELYDQVSRMRSEYADYDDVAKSGMQLMQNDEAYMAAFQASKDRARFAYELGLRERAYTSSLESEKTREAQEKAQENLSKPEMMSGTASANFNGYESLPDFRRMTDREFDEFCARRGMSCESL